MTRPLIVPKLPFQQNVLCFVFTSCIFLLSLQYSRARIVQEIFRKEQNIRRVELNGNTKRDYTSNLELEIIPKCYEKLRDAATNSTNMKLSYVEYKVFLNNISNGHFSNDKFEVEMNVTYTQLVCDYYKVIFNKTNCSDGYIIPIDSVQLGYVEQTFEQFLYLFKVCEKSVNLFKEIKSKGFIHKQELDNEQKNRLESLGFGIFSGVASAITVLLIIYACFFYLNRRNEKRMIQNIMKTTVDGEVKSFDNLDNLDRKSISTFDDLENADGSCISDHKFDESINQNCSRSDEGDSGWSSSQGFSIQSSLNVGNVKTMDYKQTSLYNIGKGNHACTLINENNPHVVKTDFQFIPVQAIFSKDENRNPEDGKITKYHSGSRADLSKGFIHNQELDNAIKAKNWAKVGITAAVLAQGPRSYFNKDSRLKISTSCNSLDRKRILDLDQLVDLGDWEAVVLLAAEYEAQTDPDGSCSESLSSYSEQMLSSDLGSIKSDNSASASSSYNGESDDIPYNAQKRAEIRLEVETLVQRLVPDEVGNIDEMMLQFRGREIELVEALGTMQGKKKQTRAMATHSYMVKMEDENSIKYKRKGISSSGSRLVLLDCQEKVDGSKFIDIAKKRPMFTPINRVGQNKSLALIPQHNQDLIHDSDDVQSLDSLVSIASGNNTNYSMNPPLKEVLKKTIQKEDYDGVSKAITMTNEGSALSVTISDLGRNVGESTTPNNKQNKYYSHKCKLNIQPESKYSGTDFFEKLIDNGDWSGVFAAATCHSTLKTYSAVMSINSTNNGRSKGKTCGTSLQDSISGDINCSSKYLSENKNIASLSLNDNFSLHNHKPTNISQEEHDAWTQADIWARISAQSKSKDFSDTKGASDAADWAIDRSLSALIHNDAYDFTTNSSRKKCTGSVSIDSLDSSNCRKSV